MELTSGVKTHTYIGLFMVTLATLMYEILLTRIFSVTMWYHFAFMAISIALFGMTAGAMLVYLVPRFFTRQRAHYHLALSALLFSVTAILSFLVHLKIPFTFDLTFRGISSLTLTYIIISIPFTFSGICVCIALTTFPKHVSKLYAADLIGAAAGCILFKYALDITDGPTAVVIVSLFASTGAVFFAATSDTFRKLRNAAVIISLVFLSVSIVHTVMVWNQSPVLRLTWIKGGTEDKPIYEKWNSFSRVSVHGNPTVMYSPFGWGLSPAYPFHMFPVRQLVIRIDAGAATPMTGFNGDLLQVDFLKYDIVNLVNYIRRDAEVLVIGAGGGRDILSALAFDQKSVIGVEINRDILDIVNNRFGEFTGRLDRNPKVTFVNDEARSYIARSKEKFDIIQISLIDTWAATAAGAFVMTENTLYTVEAWKSFLEHLDHGGVLSVSRWYFRDNPGETYRLASLATATLLEMGVENPNNHIIIARKLTNFRGMTLPNGIGTILVSNEPFSEADIATLEMVTRELQFEIIQSPKFSKESVIASITSGSGLNEFIKGFPLDISPPTDDKPFFFHMLRLRDIFNGELMQQGIGTLNMKAVATLGILLMIVFFLTMLCFIVPLIFTTDRMKLQGNSALFLFFASIGFGFILIEISQLQRLSVFLGHPTYSLSVVLFSLLISSGIGSYLTQNVGKIGLVRSAYIRLFALICVLLLFGVLTPHLTGMFRGSITPVRILMSVAMLFPMGIFMGMPFPLGMKAASARADYLTPWLWGINGATSVCGSVLAVAIALNWGISVSFWSGLAFYVLAFVALIRASRNTE